LGYDDQRNRNIDGRDGICYGQDDLSVSIVESPPPSNNNYPFYGWNFSTVWRNNYNGINGYYPELIDNWAASTGTIHYVSTSGSDSATGGIADPWLTLGGVAAGDIVPGDMIYLKRGITGTKP